MRTNTLRWGMITALFITLALALGVVGPPTTQAASVSPIQVSGNPRCSDLGYVNSYKFEPTEVGDNVTAPNGLHYDTADDISVNWSSSNFWIDAVIVKGGTEGANVYSYSPPSAGDSNLQTPTGQAISHIEFCWNTYALSATKTASGSFTRTYSWLITKDYDGTYTRFIGDPAITHGYKVSVDKSYTDSPYVVTGNITITNPAPYPVPVTISDSVSGTAATVTCPAAAVPAGGQLVCSYTATLGAPTAGTNQATITSGIPNVSGAYAEAGYAFSMSESGYSSINVTDTNGGAWTASDDASWTYTKDFACPTDQGVYANGVYTMLAHVNTATITETGQSDTATVNLTCYAPVIAKNASASYDETHTWDIEKSVTPTFQKGFAGNTLPWTWTVNVSETAAESNFAVSGYITVFNPAGSPGAMTVSLADQLDDFTLATVDCGFGATSVTVASGAQGTCSYTAAPGGRTATLNTATGTFNGIGFVATSSVNFVANVINGTATVTDTQIGLNQILTAGSGPWTFSAPDSHTCSSDATLYAGDGMYGDSEYNLAQVKNGDTVLDSDDATTAYECYAPVLMKTAYASYDEIHTWDIEKSVDPESQSGFAADNLPWTWTVNVSESAQDDNFLVEGTIYVSNPANSPGDMTVSLTDQLNDGTLAAVDCGFGATSVTVAPSAQVTCSYTASPTGKTATKNIATGTFNGIAFPAEKDFTFGVNVIGGTATVTDTEIGLDESLTAGSGPWEFSGEDSHTCSTDPSAYVDGGGTSYYDTVYNNAIVTGSDGQTDSDDATTTYTCYLWTVDKTADGSYNDQYKWDITKTVTPASQSGFAGETLEWTWSITWSSSFDKEINHAVEGDITVTNPAPIELTVDVSDFLTGGVAAVVDCDGSGGTSLTIAANSSGTCAYSAAPSSQLAQNTATASRKGVSVSDTVDVTWVPGADVGLDATISDTNGESIPVDFTPQPYTYTKSHECLGADEGDYGDDGTYSGDASNTATISWTGGTDSSTAETEYNCYLPSISKTAAGTYDERHEWTVEKDVDPTTNSGYPGDELGWTWTVTVTEEVFEENFDVTGTITVVNPNPDEALIVALMDELDVEVPVTITADDDCAYSDGLLTVPAGGTATCPYSAAPNDRTATLNTASFTLFDILYKDDAEIGWTPNVIRGTATVTDTEIGLNGSLTAGGGPWTFTGSDSHICSSNTAAYFVDGVYTAITETITNWAYVNSEDEEQDSDDATTTWTCEAGFMDLLKWTNGVVNDAKDWQFALYLGPDSFGGTQVGSTSSTLNDADGVLEFGGPALRPDTAYTVCELAVPAGWTTFWQVSLGGGTTWTTVIPYNPDADNSTPEDVGNLCVDFGADTTIPVSEGQTIHFQVNNTYPGGAPRTPGYWKNWNRCTGGRQQYTADKNGGYEEGYWLLEDVLDPTIGGGIVWDDILADNVEFNITTCEQAVLILDKRNVDGKKVASDPLHNLATHLLAAQLNFGAGACTTQQALDAALSAETLLDKYNFQGVYQGKVSKADGATANTLAGILDAYNNGMYCGDGGE